MNWSIVLARVVSMILSWADASNLRNRMYELQEKNEIMRTTLEDIKRMSKDSLINQHVTNTLDLIDNKRPK